MLLLEYIVEWQKKYGRCRNELWKYFYSYDFKQLNGFSDNGADP